MTFDTSFGEFPGVEDRMMTRVFLDDGEGAKWQCIECGYTSTKFNMKRHIQRMHGANEHMPCPGCGHILANIYNFNRHISQNHPELSHFKILTRPSAKTRNYFKNQT